MAGCLLTGRLPACTLQQAARTGGVGVTVLQPEMTIWAIGGCQEQREPSKTEGWWDMMQRRSEALLPVLLFTFTLIFFRLMQTSDLRSKRNCYWITVSTLCFSKGNRDGYKGFTCLFQSWVNWIFSPEMESDKTKASWSKTVLLKQLDANWG